MLTLVTVIGLTKHSLCCLFSKQQQTSINLNGGHLTGVISTSVFDLNIGTKIPELISVEVA